MKIRNKMVEFVFSMILRALLVSLLVGFVAVAVSQADQARERISSKRYQSLSVEIDGGSYDIQDVETNTYALYLAVSYAS